MAILWKYPILLMDGYARCLSKGLFTFLIGPGGVIGLSVIVALAYIAHCAGLNVVKLVEGFFSFRWLPSLKRRR